MKNLTRSIILALALSLLPALLVASNATTKTAIIGATPAFDDCVIPLGVTLTFLQRIPASGAQRGRDRYKVDWQVNGPMPAGLTQFSSFKVTLFGGTGRGRATLQYHGSARTSTMEVQDETSNTSAQSAQALVEGVAFTTPCNTEITSTASGETRTHNTSPCSVPLAITSKSVVGIFNPPGPGPLPSGYAVKVDWSVGQLPNCIGLAGFQLNVRVAFLDGTKKTEFRALEANARTITIKMSDSPFVSRRPAIEEIRLEVITKTTARGTTPGFRAL